MIMIIGSACFSPLSNIEMQQMLQNGRKKNPSGKKPFFTFFSVVSGAASVRLTAFHLLLS
jgi:hypothetical protein